MTAKETPSAEPPPDVDTESNRTGEKNAMSTCAMPCSKPNHIDLRLPHRPPPRQRALALPGVDPDDADVIPWPGVRRDGKNAARFAHCVDCGAPVLVFGQMPRELEEPGDDYDCEILCTECGG